MCSTGWGWNIYALNYDSRLLSWFFFPWNNSGVELFNMDLLDYLFYPVCGIMFCNIFKYLDLRVSPKYSSIKYKYFLIITYSILSMFVLIKAPVGGCAYSLVIAGIIPGIIGLGFVKSVKPSVYWFGGIFMMFFASSWDMGTVSIIPEMEGLEGTAQWMYQGLQQVGDTIIVYKSKFFIQSDWAWIEKNPLETSYFLAIASHPWLYSIYEIFYKRNHVFNNDGEIEII